MDQGAPLPADLTDPILLGLARTELIAQLAPGFVHDLNNLIGFLGGFSYRLQKKHPGEPLHDRLQEQIRALAGLAGNFQKAMRFNSEPEPFHLQELEGDIKSLRKTVLDGLSNAVSCDFDPATPPALCVPGHVHLIFAGFLRNAAEALAGSPDPAIRVWLREGSGSGFQAVFPEAPAREHGYAWLTVADSGLGIDSSLLSQISAGKAVSSKFGHAGLGLLISKTLARAHHGLIALESTPGQGTAAHLALPGTPAPSLNPASSLT